MFGRAYIFKLQQLKILIKRKPIRIENFYFYLPQNLVFFNLYTTLKMPKNAENWTELQVNGYFTSGYISKSLNKFYFSCLGSIMRSGVEIQSYLSISEIHKNIQNFLHKIAIISVTGAVSMRGT